ncbi:L-aspartate oxidase [Longimonas halophila]|uniref:L-aspartate oxidase n=1 Tax=Longimonas halophila TaxID=1469170 RepID=A0A2H3NQF4_9BACT|nr:L-aspartate oxidase [Longimonas halophila]PEN09511.1 L-aspartate oxidase [Longimonas halophila]
MDTITPQTDFLVIGSGVAGLTFAVKAAAYGRVTVITKDDLSETNTSYAQGGIAAVVDESDSPEQHLEDTLDAGAGLCNPEIVSIVVNEGPKRLHELIEWGAHFTRTNGSDALHLGREGGHSANRIVHADDATGAEVQRALMEQVQAHPSIDLHPQHTAVDLLTEHHLGQHVNRMRPDVHCFGAYVLDRTTGTVHTVQAQATVLAAGGCGQVYQHTTNPPVATGDGVAMAYRAKARVSNMEFVQFHPTSLYHPDADSFLISEAVRGEGGRLYNRQGERFMPEYDDRAELAPRDIVARAIDDQMKRHGDDHVWLDISHKSAEAIRGHFPMIAETCQQYGIDITEEPIPVVPAAHYMCGGVQTDAHGRTSINQLYAIGEVACTGLHGANRLASNSLVEGLVFGHRAMQVAKDDLDNAHTPKSIPDWDHSGTEAPGEEILMTHNRDELKRVMSNYVGIVRSDVRLKRAARRIHLLYEETEAFYQEAHVSTRLCELRNMITTCYLIVRSARMRRESRGLHYTVDYPEAEATEQRATRL